MLTHCGDVFVQNYSIKISKGYIPFLKYPRLSESTGSAPEAECSRTIGLGSCGTAFEIPEIEFA